MKPFSTIVISLLAISALLAQGRDAPPCFPATVGSKWVYDENGQEVTEVVTESVADDGLRRVSLGRMAADSSVKPHEKLLVTDWCIFRIERGGVPEKPASSLLILPSSFRDAARPEAIEVPAGKFVAYPVRLRTYLAVPLSFAVLTLYENRWYVPQIGLVKSESGYMNGSDPVPLVKCELKKFTPGK